MHLAIKYKSFNAVKSEIMDRLYSGGRGSDGAGGGTWVFPENPLILSHHLQVKGCNFYASLFFLTCIEGVFGLCERSVIPNIHRPVALTGTHHD